MTEFAIYGGVDHRDTIGKVAPGVFAQEGRCWRMIYANPVGHGTHCMEPVEWGGRWKFLAGLTRVWSCERHADELVGARRLPRDRYLKQAPFSPSVGRGIEPASGGSRHLGLRDALQPDC
jgi:hypothetical protein